ncbi:MAG: hypothetical protein Q4B32_08080 [Clostridia bacterium]|nr:hypothetical protein [Clostridia bacterium]
MKKFFEHASKIGLCVGCLIAIAGIVMLFLAPAVLYFPYGHEYRSTCRFGGDFYTEMYGVTKTILDQLNGFSSSVATGLDYLYTALRAIYYAVSALIISIGLSVAALSCRKPPKKPDDEHQKLEELLSKNAEVNTQLAEALAALKAPTEQPHEADEQPAEVAEQPEEETAQPEENPVPQEAASIPEAADEQLDMAEPDTNE